MRDDASDNLFLALAAASAARFICSGARHLLDIGEHRGIPIVTPSEAVAVVAEVAGREG